LRRNIDTILSIWWQFGAAPLSDTDPGCANWVCVCVLRRGLEINSSDSDSACPKGLVGLPQNSKLLRHRASRSFPGIVRLQAPLAPRNLWPRTKVACAHLPRHTSEQSLHLVRSPVNERIVHVNQNAWEIV
jgi:hypothetical protein